MGRFYQEGHARKKMLDHLRNSSYHYLDEEEAKVHEEAYDFAACMHEETDDERNANLDDDEGTLEPPPQRRRLNTVALRPAEPSRAHASGPSRASGRQQIVPAARQQDQGQQQRSIYQLAKVKCIIAHIPEQASPVFCFLHSIQ